MPTDREEVSSVIQRTALSNGLLYLGLDVKVVDKTLPKSLEVSWSGTHGNMQACNNGLPTATNSMVGPSVGRQSLPPHRPIPQ